MRTTLSKLIKALDLVKPFITDSSSRFSIDCACFDGDEIKATDGRRCLILKNPYFKTDPQDQFRVKEFSRIKSLIQGFSMSYVVEVELSIVRVHGDYHLKIQTYSDDNALESLLIDHRGIFPSTDYIYPKKEHHAKTKINKIQYKVKDLPENITLKISSGEGFELKLNNEHPQDYSEVRVKSSYFHDGIKLAKKLGVKELDFYMDSSSKPILMSCKAFDYILMPASPK